MDESEETIDMCKAIEDLREEAMQAGIQTGRKVGREEEKEKIILRMVKKEKYPYEEIAELAEISVEKVKELGMKNI